MSKSLGSISFEDYSGNTITISDNIVAYDSGKLISSIKFDYTWDFNDITVTIPKGIIRQTNEGITIKTDQFTLARGDLIFRSDY